MLVYASLFDCVDPILTIASSLGGKSPFQSPLDKREKAGAAHAAYCSRAMLKYNDILSVPFESASSSASATFPYSDHIAVIRAFDIWHHIFKSQGGQAAYTYCRDNFLSSSGMEEIRGLREQLRAYMKDANLILPVGCVSTCDDELDGEKEAIHENSRVEEVGSVSELIVRTTICAGMSRLRHL